MSVEHVDCLVVGGGPGGLDAAQAAAALGQRTVLVEAHRLGGTCLHVGCIPAKLLLERAHHLAAPPQAPEGDWNAFRTRMTELVSRHERGAAQSLRRAGVEVLHGRARQADDGTVSIDGSIESAPDRVLRATQVVIATGSEPAPAPFTIEGPAALTTDELFHLDRLPRRMLIVGAGAVGVETADALVRLGVPVTLVEMADQVLPGEDERVSSVLLDALTGRGVKVRLERRVAAVRAPGSGGMRAVEFDDGSAEETDGLLLAIGRRAVDAELRGDRIGDAAGGGFAHEASAMGHALVRTGDPARIGAVPRCVYTSPEVAAVGLTERGAAAEGHEVVIGDVPWSANPRADIQERAGLTRLVADRRSGRILGLHLVGDGASELIALGCMLLDFEAGLPDLRWLVLPHPTLSETVAQAAERCLAQLDGHA